MSFAPGTVFRAYTIRGDHNTAVLLKDGSVLEVKNPHSNTKTTYPSIDAWMAHVKALRMKADTSGARGAIIGPAPEGIHYPTEDHRAYTWVRGLYSLVCELGPELLKSEEFAVAYNALVATCTKYKQELYHYSTLFKGYKRYAPLIVENVAINPPLAYRYPGYFPYSYMSKTPYTGAGHKSWTKEDYEAARDELEAGYIAVCQVVMPVIGKKMAKKYDIMWTRRRLNSAQSTIRRYLAKAKRCQIAADFHKAAADRISKSIPKWQQELSTAEQEFMGI